MYICSLGCLSHCAVLSVCLSVFVSFYLSVCLLVCVCFCKSLHLLIFVCVCVSVCLSVCLSVCTYSMCFLLSICLFVYWYRVMAKIIPSDLTKECHVMSTEYSSLPGHCSPGTFESQSMWQGAFVDAYTYLLSL